MSPEAKDKLFTVLAWIMGIAIGAFIVVPWYIEKDAYWAIRARYPQLPLVLGVTFFVMVVSLLWLEWSAKKQRSRRLDETNPLHNSETE